MTLVDSPRVTPASEWLSAFVPLGLQRDEVWTPLGAGVLLVDAPVVWLVTARRVLEAAGDQRLTALVRGPGDQPVLIDLVTGRGPGTALAWLTHAERDLAALLFPLQAGWQVKAFSEARCLALDEVEPLQRTGIVSAVYGLDGRADPRPAALDGAVARVDPAREEILTSAPLLPRNAGAPLVVALPPQSGGGVALAGIATQTLTVSEPHQSSAAPVRLAVAVSIAAALALVRGEAGRAQRTLAIESSRKP